MQHGHILHGCRFYPTFFYIVSNIRGKHRTRVNRMIRRPRGARAFSLLATSQQINNNRGHPLAVPCQASKRSQLQRKLPIPFLQYRYNKPTRARFFKLWLRRIAPDTHLDQAIGGGETAFALTAFAAPEERWCRSVSNGLITDPWLPIFRCQSLAGSRCGRSAFVARVTAG